MDHPVDDRPLEKLAASADHHPAQAMKPAPVVECSEKPLDVGAILDQDEEV